MLRESMVASLLFAFCRLVLGFVFALSLVGKLRHVQTFRQTILTFRLLPDRLVGIATWFFLGSEFLVVLGIMLGGLFLLPAFLLATLLLILFSVAMASVLVRQVHTPCSCFGKSDKPVSVADLWRNGGFLCCALGGCVLLFWPPQEYDHLTLAVWFLAGAAAIVFVALELSLGDLVALFKSP
jgi:uncharacterized membrane protein YphA (DoxX/SURF4 family)